MKDCVQTVEVIDVEKRRFPGKHYVYVISVTWTDGSTNIIYRRYSAFDRLQLSLLESFPQEEGVDIPEDRTLPVLPGKIFFGRSHIRDVALKRLKPLDNYCKLLTKLEPPISQCPDVLTFFQSSAEDIAAVTQPKKNDMKSISTPLLLEQYVAVYDFSKQRKDEIDIKVGDSVEVIEKYEHGWWLVNKNSEQGYVPGNYLKRSDSLKDSRTLTENCGEKYVCIKAFEPEGPDDHSMRIGVIVELIQKNLDGWWWVSINGKAGWAPATCLKLAVQEKLDNRNCSQVETITNLSEVSELLKGDIISDANSHIISVDIETKANKPMKVNCPNDDESDEFSDDNDDDEEGYYSSITYAPAPKRRDTYKNMKAASLKKFEKQQNDIIDVSSCDSSKVTDDEEYANPNDEEYLNANEISSDTNNIDNASTVEKDWKSEKNFADELQSKLRSSSANIAAKNGASSRPKFIPPPPPKRPDSAAPKKKMSEPNEGTVKPFKPVVNEGNESNFADELHSKLGKLKNSRQVSKADTTQRSNYQPLKPPIFNKPPLPKEKPVGINIFTVSQPESHQLSLADTLKTKQNNCSSHFRSNNNEDKEIKSTEKAAILPNVSKLSDRIAKFESQGGPKEKNLTTGNKQGLNLLRRQQEKHRESNAPDNTYEISSGLKPVSGTKQVNPVVPVKPPVPALKPKIKCSKDVLPPKSSSLLPKQKSNINQFNPHPLVTKPQKITVAVSESPDCTVTAQSLQCSPRDRIMEKSAADVSEIKYQASCSYQAENEEEISFSRHDIVEVLQKDESGWWLVRLGSQEGWAPSNHIEEVKPINNRKLLPPKKPLPKLNPENSASSPKKDSYNNNTNINTNTNIDNNNTNNNTISTSCTENNDSNDATNISADCQYVVLEDFSAFSEEELSVEEGMHVSVIDSSNCDWWYVSLDSGEEGWVPANCLSNLQSL
ncbi:SH3 and PX domain-containing protein 2A-like [Argonauta hians]